MGTTCGMNSSENAEPGSGSLKAHPPSTPPSGPQLLLPKIPCVLLSCTFSGALATGMVTGWTVSLLLGRWIRWVCFQSGSECQLPVCGLQATGFPSRDQRSRHTQTFGASVETHSRN